jgi:hypothetical protein
MSVSAVSAPAPVSIPQASASNAPVVKPDVDAADDAGAAPKPAPAPLPPGQGTRIDQLV